MNLETQYDAATAELETQLAQDKAAIDAFKEQIKTASSDPTETRLARLESACAYLAERYAENRLLLLSLTRNWKVVESLLKEMVEHGSGTVANDNKSNQAV